MVDSLEARPPHPRREREHPMRVLVVSQLPPPFHGSAAMTRTFLEMLSRVGVEHDLIDRRFSRSIDEVGVPSGRKLVRAAALAAQLARRADPRRYDLVVYFVATSLGALAIDGLMLRILRARGLPCWLYFHGRGYKQAAERGGRETRVVAFALATAAGGVVLSERLIPDVDAWIPRDRLFVIPNAITDTGAPAHRSTAAESVCRFLYLSNLIPSKGAMEFVEAASIVVEQNPRCTFRIHGEVQDVAFATRVDEKARELHGRLVRGPAIYGQEKQEAFLDSDVFVFPTYYEFETFGLVNLEAMCAGIPVIATDVGGIPDVVLHGVTGEIVPPRDVPALAGAMIRFASSPEHRARMGAAGRRRFLERFTPSAYDAAWSEALVRMAGAARRR